MARPLRIEIPGAIYHVISRGDRREPIFADDEDRIMLLSVMGDASKRFEAAMWSYCLMGNRYHFVLQTHQANLSKVMRHINGVYTQTFNAPTARADTFSRADSGRSSWTLRLTCWKSVGTWS